MALMEEPEEDLNELERHAEDEREWTKVRSFFTGKFHLSETTSVFQKLLHRIHTYAPTRYVGHLLSR